MKSFLILFFFISFINSYSQTEDDSKVIYLDEVIIQNESEDKKKFVYKTKGRTKAALSVDDNNVFLTRINNDKKIKLKSLSLFFNNKANYKDNIIFELIILMENGQGKPSNSLVDKNIKFEVKPLNDEKIKLDLTELDLSVKNPFFIGLKKISKSGNLDFSIKLNRKKGEFIFIKNKLCEWIKIHDSNIKLEIGYVKD